jgi:multisubunit Na+/H+ antiporter MnhG subunit
MSWQKKHSSLLVIIIGFAILFFLFRKEWMILPILITMIGFLINPLGEYIHLFWMMIAKVLGYINSRIFLFILFFFILTPVALLMRLLGKATYFKNSEKRNTLFEQRNHLYVKEDIEHPF